MKTIMAINPEKTSRLRQLFIFSSRGFFKAVNRDAVNDSSLQWKLRIDDNSNTQLQWQSNRLRNTTRLRAVKSRSNRSHDRIEDL